MAQQQVTIKVNIDAREAIEQLKELEHHTAALRKEIEALEKSKKQAAGYVDIDDLRKAAGLP